MSVREIRLFGDPILVTPSLEILDFASAAGLIQDLIDTASLSGRAGVAATQIGVGLSAFAYNIEGEIGYLINPKITELSGDIVAMEEWCLSVPGLWHQAMRHSFARASGFLLEGLSNRVACNSADDLTSPNDFDPATVSLGRISYWLRFIWFISWKL